MTMRLERIPAAGETVTGGAFTLGPGGKGSNQAIAARRLGAAVDLLTCVGPDRFGLDARELWERESVGAEQVKTGVRPTMVGFILVEPTGENRIVIAPGALEELCPSDVERFAGPIEAADVCLVSLEIPLDTAVAALALAREVGTTTVLNPAPASDLPDEAWPLIDVLVPNEHEAATLCGLDPAAPGGVDPPGDLDARQLLRRLQERLPGGCVLTLGAAGAVVGADGARVHLEAATVSRVVDTTGAGDAFSAALSVALAEGRPLLDAARFANVAAAFSVQTAEVIPSLPFRADIAAEVGEA